MTWNRFTILFGPAEKGLPIGFVAGVGDFAFPFASEPLAIDFPLA